MRKIYKVYEMMFWPLPGEKMDIRYKGESVSEAKAMAKKVAKEWANPGERVHVWDVGSPDNKPNIKLTGYCVDESDYGAMLVEVTKNAEE